MQNRTNKNALFEEHFQEALTFGAREPKKHLRPKAQCLCVSILQILHRTLCETAYTYGAQHWETWADAQMFGTFPAILKIYGDQKSAMALHPSPFARCVGNVAKSLGRCLGNCRCWLHQIYAKDPCWIWSKCFFPLCKGGNGSCAHFPLAFVNDVWQKVLPFAFFSLRPSHENHWGSLKYPFIGLAQGFTRDSQTWGVP